MRAEDEIVDDEKTGFVQAELIASYFAFAGRAIRARRLLSAAIFFCLAAITIGLVSIWPRTYHCEMKLMVQRTDMLTVHGEKGEGLKSIAETIARHENLEAIVKQADVVKTWAMRRPPALRLKDSIMSLLHGEMSEADKTSMLVATLESRLSLTATDSTLTIGVDWPDPQMAARLVDTTYSNFLQMRHGVEVSTIAELIAILEGHATQLREEIDGIADQVQKLTEERSKSSARSAAPAPDASQTPQAPQRPAPRPRLMPDEELPRLKTTLELKQSTLKQLQEDRKRRVIELEAKLTEMKARYTPAYPAVVDLERQVAAMSEDTGEIASLKSSVDQLEAEIKARNSAYLGGGSVRPDSPRGANPASTAGGADAPPAAGPLPTDIMQLVQSSAEGLDPAIAAQFRYVVGKYTTVRDQISTARIDLDTAQAAFRHRYKVVMPAEVPLQPIKPKALVMVAGGLIFGLFLALLTPVALELRRGRIIEKWQVAQIELPVLAELRFPPSSAD
jgi:uncharacterized protein involved in exopolysaccharide biosynthesis